MTKSTLLSAVKMSVIRAFGDAFRNLNKQQQDEVLSTALVEAAGSGDGFILFAAKVPKNARTLDYYSVRSGISSQVLADYLVPILRSVGQNMVDAARKEKQVSGGDDSNVNDILDAFELTSREESSEEKETEGLDVADLSGSLSETISTLYLIHFGELAVPGTPASWANRYYYDNKQKKNIFIPGPAYLALKDYHKLGVTEPCPMCKRMAKFFRIPGLTPEVLQKTIDQALVRHRAAPKY